MEKNDKCLGTVAFEIENGKLVNYVNGEKTPDPVPARTRLILSQYLKETNSRIKDVLIDYNFVYRILQLDLEATKDITLEWDGVIYEQDDEGDDLSEYIPEILIYLHGLGLVRSKIDETLIRQILYATDIVIAKSFE